MKKEYTIGITLWNGEKYIERIVKITDNSLRLAIMTAASHDFTKENDIRKIQVYDEKVVKTYRKRVLIEVLYERTRFKILQRFAKPITFITYDPITDEYEDHNAEQFYELVKRKRIDMDGHHKVTIVRRVK